MAGRFGLASAAVDQALDAAGHRRSGAGCRPQTEQAGSSRPAHPLRQSHPAARTTRSRHQRQAWTDASAGQTSRPAAQAGQPIRTPCNPASKTTHRQGRSARKNSEQAKNETAQTPFQAVQDGRPTAVADAQPGGDRARAQIIESANRQPGQTSTAITYFSCAAGTSYMVRR